MYILYPCQLSNTTIELNNVDGHAKYTQQCPRTAWHEEHARKYYSLTDVSTCTKNTLTSIVQIKLYIYIYSSYANAINVKGTCVFFTFFPM